MTPAPKEMISPNAPHRRWLCIAYAFPPIRRSGTHRTLGFVRHLSGHGWDATVLTVEPGDEPTDAQLLQELPQATRVVRTPWTDWVPALKNLSRSCVTPASGQCDHGLEARATPEIELRSKGRFAGGGATHAETVCAPLETYSHRACGTDSQPMPAPVGNRCHTPPGWALTRATAGNPSQVASRGVRDWVSRFLQIPDSRLGWLLPAIRAGLRAARDDRPEVIYSTSPYATAHLIAMVVAAWTRRPWIADFRDPWVDNPFRNVPRPTLRWWDAFLESRVLRRASHIVCATPTMTARLVERFPPLREKCTTILNGFDSARFASVTPLRDADRDACVLVHAGQFYGSRSPAAWFRAVVAANDGAATGRAATEHGSIGSHFGRRSVRLHLIGPSHYDGRPLTELAAQAGAGDAVRVLGERSHAETLARIVGADGVLLPTASGDGSQLQVPNKLFEYLVLRRPILAAADTANPVCAILRDAHADAAIVGPEDANALAIAMIRLSEHRSFGTERAWSHVDAYDRVHRADELLTLFGRITRSAERSWDSPSTHRDRILARDYAKPLVE